MQEPSAQKAPTTSTKILKALLAKAGIEIFVMMAAISFAAYSHLNPPIRGAIDIADSTRIAGWAYDPRAPEDHLAVQLFVDGKFVAMKLADEPRDDLVSAGAAANSPHGFSFAMPELKLMNGIHRINVYALRSGGGVNKSLLSITKKPQQIEIK